MPLLLLTADRPAELREIGAGQAIDQLKLYGSAVKWFFEVAPAGAAAAAAALDPHAGLPRLLDGARRPPGRGAPQLPAARAARRRPRRRRRTTAAARRAARSCAAAAAQVASTADSFVPCMSAIEGAQRGVLVAGRHERGTPLGEAASTFAEAAGWPLLADPMSGARRGDAAIAHYDALLRVDRLAAELTPDLVLRVGDLPVSKPLRGWLAGLREVPQIALDPEGAWQDPDAAVSLSLPLDPAETLSALAGVRRHGRRPAGGGARLAGRLARRGRAARGRRSRASLATAGLSRAGGRG